MISVVAPRELVKAVKIKLEHAKVLDKSTKIHQLKFLDQDDGDAERFVLTTTLNSGSDDNDAARCLALSQNVDLSDFGDQIEISTQPEAAGPRPREDPIAQAFGAWLRAAHGDLIANEKIDSLCKAFKPYSVYKPLLLLPFHFSSSRDLAELLKQCTADSIKALFDSISRAFGVTHIAANAPIPLIAPRGCESDRPAEENVLRSPSNLIPLYGDFGPLVTTPHPSLEDIDQALWASTKQNGLHQVWAPRYTMFSRGNIKEKTRILHMDSVRKVADEGSTVVDLYAGIGYFAFSYANAGMRKVLCFEMNPWSVEGLRRGATKNKWRFATFDESNLHTMSEADVDPQAAFYLFQMDNAHAVEVVEKLRHSLPPIRHVNCGLLPTSKGSWKTALDVLDPERGGWLHVHENSKESDIGIMSNAVVDSLKSLDTSGKRISLDHVERVKSYAPGIIHCVLDIYVAPN